MLVKVEPGGYVMCIDKKKIATYNQATIPEK